MQSPYALLSIAGQDVAGFLQGQLTCNVLQVTQNSVAFTALCNTQGRVVASGWLAKMENEFLWVLPTAMVDIAQTALKKYARFSPVTLTPFAAKYQLQLQQKTTDKLTVRLTPLAPDAPIASWDISQWHAWQYQCLQQGITLIDTAEDSGRFTPHELGYPFIDGTIDFHKGCYLGQEIVARMYYRGHLKRHLHHVVLTNFPENLNLSDTVKKLLGEDSHIRLALPAASHISGEWEILVIADDGRIEMAHTAGKLIRRQTYGKN